MTTWLLLVLFGGHGLGITAPLGLGFDFWSLNTNPTKSISVMTDSREI